MESGHHGTDRNVEHLGDLLVGEALHIGEQHGQTERLRKVVERLLDVVIGDQVEQLVLGRTARRRGLDRSDPAVQVEILDVGEVGLLGPALAGPVEVDVRVGEDAEQPGPQVGAGGEIGVAAVAAQVGLLDEVGGVGLVARHPQRRGIQLRGELHGVALERRGVGHDSDDGRLAGIRSACCGGRRRPVQVGSVSRSRPSWRRRRRRGRAPGVPAGSRAGVGGGGAGRGSITGSWRNWCRGIEHAGEGVDSCRRPGDGPPTPGKAGDRWARSRVAIGGRVRQRISKLGLDARLVGEHEEHGDGVLAQHARGAAGVGARARHGQLVPSGDEHRHRTEGGRVGAVDLVGRAPGRRRGAPRTDRGGSPARGRRRPRGGCRSR